MKNNQSYLGYPKRSTNFWCNKFKYHYCVDSYTYSVLTTTYGQEIISYSLLGRTNDGIERLDILEFISPDDKHVHYQLFDSVMHYAYSINIGEIRVQALQDDILLKYAIEYGFEKDGNKFNGKNA